LKCTSLSKRDFFSSRKASQSNSSLQADALILKFQRQAHKASKFQQPFDKATSSFRALTLRTKLKNSVERMKSLNYVIDEQEVRDKQLKYRQRAF